MNGSRMGCHGWCHRNKGFTLHRALEAYSWAVVSPVCLLEKKAEMYEDLLRILLPGLFGSFRCAWIWEAISCVFSSCSLPIQYNQRIWNQKIVYLDESVRI